jgi:colicin import membrane protein
MQKSYNTISVILALILHAVVFVLLFSSLKFYATTAKPMMAYVPKAHQEKIVNAVTVNQQKVQAAIKKIKAEKKAKHDAQVAWERKLARKARRAKQQRVQEQKRVTKLKTQRKKLERQRRKQAKAASSKIAQMKGEQQKLQRQLSALKEQQQTLQEANAISTNKQAESNLQNQIQAEETQIAAAKASYINSEVGRYKALITNALGQRWIMPLHLDKKLSTLLLIKLAPGGVVLDVKILKGSGNKVLDRSVVTAVWKASPLPVPSNAEVFDQFRELHLTVKPEGLLNG